MQSSELHCYCISFEYVRYANQIDNFKISRCVVLPRREFNGFFTRPRFFAIFQQPHPSQSRLCWSLWIARKHPGVASTERIAADSVAFFVREIRNEFSELRPILSEYFWRIGLKGHG